MPFIGECLGGRYSLVRNRIFPNLFVWCHFYLVKLHFKKVSRKWFSLKEMYNVRNEIGVHAITLPAGDRQGCGYGGALTVISATAESLPDLCCTFCFRL